MMKDLRRLNAGESHKSKETRWFMVHVSCTIGGKSYKNGVCYPLISAIVPSIEGLVAEKRATIYEQEMRIISGVAHPLPPAVSQGRKTVPPDPRKLSLSPLATRLAPLTNKNPRMLTGL
jgi:hypothetical protein